MSDAEAGTGGAGSPAASARPLAGRQRWRSLATPRTGALAGVAVLTLGYLSTLYEVMGQTGTRSWLVAAVGAGLLAALLVARQPERRVLPVAALLGIGSLVWYVEATLGGVGVASARSGLADTIAMLSGISVTRMAATELWVVAVVVPTVFLSAYLAARERYVLATLAGGWLGLMLALTGDAVSETGVAAFDTLVCTLGAAMAVGFGELDRREGSIAAADGLVVLVAVMAVLGMFVPLVPAGQAATLSPSETGVGGGGGDGGGDGAQRAALQDQLLQGGEANPGGPLELSPEVQFVVDADEPRRWRVDVYDQYDGQRWYNRGRQRPYRGTLLSPPGETRTVSQQYELQRPSPESVPHAARPADVAGLPAESLAVTPAGVVRSTTQLPSGAAYEVQSEVPNATVTDLREAGEDYPRHVRETNLAVDDSTPRRVHEIAANVTEGATNDYDRAVAVEQFLEREKEYSLNVTRPDGPLAHVFLTQMEAGYCTYFAGTMATMLRTQDVPARVAVGYKSGQYVDEDTRVVRGTDAHAWVEVYFPDVGWVEFDPTPSSSWAREHAGAVEDAREAGVEGVDVPASENQSVRFDPPDEFEPEDDTTDGGSSGEDPGGSTNDSEGGIDPSQFPDVGGVNDTDEPLVDPNESAGERNGTNESVALDPTTGPRHLLDGLEWQLFGVVLLAGAVAGARRSGATVRLRRTVGLLWQRRVDPGTDARRARERLERVLARRYEPRQPGETPRAYLRRLPDDVDERVRRAYECYEALQYAAGPDPETADELVGLVDALARESVPVLGRLPR